MQVLVIMQGVPGSGKSTVASGIQEELSLTKGPARICSTDDYFYDEDGVYKFEKEEIGRAHQWNQREAASALGRGESVIVDNTNIKRWEARPYVEMAVALGIPVIFLRVSGHVFGNTHGVPEEAVQKMASEMEDLSVESCMQAKYPWEDKENEVEQAGAGSVE